MTKWLTLSRSMMIAAGLENTVVRQVLNPARSQVAEHQRVTDRCGPQRHADKRHGMYDARPRCNYATGTQRTLVWIFTLHTATHRYANRSLVAIVFRCCAHFVRSERISLRAVDNCSGTDMSPLYV